MSTESLTTPPVTQARATKEGCTLTFICPGCKVEHNVPVEGPQAWGWNQSLERPTLTPSVLTWGNSRLADPPGEPSGPWRCHSFITDGRIQFLPDCTHELAGKTVDLEVVND